VAGRGNPEANLWFDSQLLNETRGLPPGWRGVFHVVERSGLWAEGLPTVLDGASNTLMVGEYATRTRPDRRTYWAYSYNSFTLSSVVPERRILLSDYEQCVGSLASGWREEQSCKRAWGSFHSGVINFAMCDGSVRGVSRDIDLRTLESLSTIAGGEIIREW
jgi:prepilin-type processing-associated H-X9-DG protein